MKPLEGYIVKSKGQWYIDREDIMTGEQIAKPGTEITFKYKKKLYSGYITDNAVGRDDDAYEMVAVREIKL